MSLKRGQGSVSERRKKGEKNKKREQERGNFMKRKISSKLYIRRQKMKKFVFIFLISALILSSVLQSKTLGRSSNSIESISRKPIDVFAVIPSYSANKYGSLLEALKARYNTKIIDEKDISSLPLPEHGMCFITFGDKNLLKQQLEKGLVKFSVKDIPTNKDDVTESRNEMEKTALIHNPGIKLDLGDSEQYTSVLYGVRILPNGATDEIEGQSNLGIPDLESITNWIEETYSDSLSDAKSLPKPTSTQASASWVLKGSCTNYSERYPYGKVYYGVQFWKLVNEGDNTYDYWAVAYTNYSTIPGWYLYNSGYQTYLAWIYNVPLSSAETLLDWDPTSTVSNTSYTVTIGGSPTLSWTYSIPAIIVYDYSDPTPSANKTCWYVDYANSRDQAACTATFANRPGSEFRIPNGSSFGIQLLFTGGFAYSHWYGWDSTAYATAAIGNYSVGP